MFSKRKSLSFREIYTTNLRNDMISSICFKLIWEGESWDLDETMSLMIFSSTDGFMGIYCTSLSTFVYV